MSEGSRLQRFCGSLALGAGHSLPAFRHSPFPYRRISRVRVLSRSAVAATTLVVAGALAGATPASAAVQPWVAAVSAPSTYAFQPGQRAAVAIELTTTAPAQKVEIWAAAASAIPAEALRFEDVVFTPTDGSGTHWRGELADLGGWKLAAGTYQLGVAGITWANDSGASVG